MAAPEPPVAGVVLAAGTSSRMAPPAKQLRLFSGEPLVRRATRVALAAGLAPVVVVTGHCAAEVERVLSGLPVRVVRNPDYSGGQASSVGAGVRELAHDSVAAAVFVPCDQPFLDRETIVTIVRSHRAGATIVVPRAGQTIGAPVLFARAWFPELLLLTGDQGGRALLARHRDAVRYADLPSDLGLQDIDSEEDLVRLAALAAQAPAARTRR